MARKKSSHLTEAELRLMQVLWTRGPATVAEVLDALPAKPALAYSTVITTLRILETKGYVRHTKDGRAFHYEPVVARQDARRSALHQLLHRFFEGSPELLMASLFETGEIDRAEFRRLRKLIDQAERKS
ncbi:MAG TPA: BlaI/MecI/CopY family transcriptional regulator [Verrucomicrobiae bacterium]|nr:BlaI/MecI/CopY family transcriptional regulator [Verrucomicrobiae bacterium]